MYSDKEKQEVSSLYGTCSAAQNKYYDFNKLKEFFERRLTFKLLERRNHGEADKSRSNRKG